MLSHDEMVALQATRHDLVKTSDFASEQEYVLHLIHTKPYATIAAMAAGKRVLDLGCNNGHGTSVLSATAAAVVGVDVSPDAIAAARDAHPENVFRVVDGTHLPFERGSFDVVVSCQVIEHIVDYETYIGEMKRVLAPGGVCVLTTPNARLRLDPGMKPWNEFHVREFTEEELAALASRYFRHVRVCGLFAAEPLQSIERARIAQARRSARDAAAPASGPPPSIALAKKLIPAALLPIAGRAWSLLTAAATRRRQPTPPKASFIRANGIDRLHYRSHDLGDALDLLAVCTDDVRAFEASRGQLC